MNTSSLAADSTTSAAGTLSPGGDRQLLMSKLVVPTTRRGAIGRPRLQELLEEATTPITVIVAPAGWGKTTLLAQWAGSSQKDQHLGWVTIDRTDQDPARFWTYLITAWRNAGSEVGAKALASLRMPGLDPIEAALPSLLNDLTEHTTRHVMVLDDFHHLTERTITEAVEFLVTYLPSNTRLVLSARFDPPLPLARWRANGTLTEIRADGLRFSLAEAEEMLAKIIQLDLDRDQVAGLVDRTEGWAAALQLAALTLRGSPQQEQQALSIRGDNRHLIDYLSSEVLTSLNDRQHNFLLRSSVLERLSGPLCDAALGINGSGAILEELERENLFVVPLDDHRRWYRYHALIRDALRRELERTGGGEVADTLRRAAAWFLDQGEVEQAVRHLIAAGDQDQAATLLLAHENQFIDSGTIGVFLELADSLGGDAARRFPRLGISMAWAAGLSGRADRVLRLLEMAESAIHGDEPILDFTTHQGAASTLRALFAYQRSEDVSLALAEAERARELETDPRLAGYVVARLALGTVLGRMDRYLDALPILEEAWTKAQVVEMPIFARLPTAAALARCLLMVDRADRARQVIKEAEPAARALEDLLGDAAGLAISSLHEIEGRLEHLAGRIAPACQILARAAAMARVAGQPSPTVSVLTALAEAELARGNRAAAYSALAEARGVVDEEPVYPAVVSRLQQAETRLGQLAMGEAQDQGILIEKLHDRELSILRALQGPLNQREIGRELFLSINTIKGYTKSLYRKLGVVSRRDAVERGRQLGLI